MAGRIRGVFTFEGILTWTPSDPTPSLQIVLTPLSLLIKYWSILPNPIKYTEAQRKTSLAKLKCLSLEDVARFRLEGASDSSAAEHFSVVA